MVIAHWPLRLILKINKKLADEAQTYGIIFLTEKKLL